MGPLFVILTASVLLLWVALIIVSICVVLALENDSPGWATFSIAATFGILWLFTDFSTRYDIRHLVTWQTLVTVAIGYIVAGIAWSFIKWYLELSERREMWDESIREYRRSKGIPHDTVISSKDQELVNFLGNRSKYADFIVRDTDARSPNMYKVRVRPDPNKSRITGWMIYWPWSVLWSIFDDLIRGIFRFIYRHLTGSYEAMARWMFRGIDE